MSAMSAISAISAKSAKSAMSFFFGAGIAVSIMVA